MEIVIWCRYYKIWLSHIFFQLFCDLVKKHHHISISPWYQIQIPAILFLQQHFLQTWLSIFFPLHESRRCNQMGIPEMSLLMKWDAFFLDGYCIFEYWLYSKQGMAIRPGFVLILFLLYIHIRHHLSNRYLLHPFCLPL